MKNIVLMEKFLTVIVNIVKEKELNDIKGFWLYIVRTIELKMMMK